jgi:hypothetical protein
LQIYDDFIYFATANQNTIQVWKPVKSLVPQVRFTNHMNADFEHQDLAPLVTQQLTHSENEFVESLQKQPSKLFSSVPVGPITETVSNWIPQKSESKLFDDLSEITKYDFLLFKN